VTALSNCLLLVICLVTSSCAHRTSPAVAPVNVPPQGTTTQVRDTHERLNGLLWVQTSAEYHVLAAATYRDAWRRVHSLLDDAKAGKPLPSAMIEQPGQNTSNLPLAVVVDIDETVFDNSPMSGKLVTQRIGYTTTVWDNWVALEQAEFIVGAEQFIANARAAGLEVFFVTNRTESEEAHTIPTSDP
jgi:5'-nucleotidase (lipoprotein e(P4) family)